LPLISILAIGLSLAFFCGLIAVKLTDIPGVSAVFDRAFVTYSNESKTEMLGVEQNLIAAHGAVSEPVAKAMAEGAMTRSKTHLAVAVTGIAGPGGGTPEKPVGLVYIAVARRNGEVACTRNIFPGDREKIRLATVEKALQMLYEVAKAY